MSYQRYFARFLTQDPERLHVAAHSHHPWPDVTFEAQQRAWLDAATRHDDKWDLLLGEVMPEAGRHVARQLGLSHAGTVTFAPNTHELVLRLLSCLPVPTRILTTDNDTVSGQTHTRFQPSTALEVLHTRSPRQPMCIRRTATVALRTVVARLPSDGQAGGVGHDALAEYERCFADPHMSPSSTALRCGVVDPRMPPHTQPAAETPLTPVTQVTCGGWGRRGVRLASIG